MTLAVMTEVEKKKMNKIRELFSRGTSLKVIYMVHESEI